MKYHPCMSVVITSILIALLLLNRAHAAEDNIAIELNAGLSLSPEYRDLLDDEVGVLSGAYGWLTIGAGVSWTATTSLRFNLGLDWLVSVGEYADGTTLTNSLLIPNIGVRWSPMDDSGFYVKLEGLSSKPKSKFDNLEIESGGAGFGAHLGYRNENGGRLEFGIRTIPVEIVRSQQQIEEKDFGGVVLRVYKEI